MVLLIVKAATVLPFDPCKPHIPWSYLGALLQVLLDWVLLERGSEGLERARAPLNKQNKSFTLQYVFRKTINNDKRETTENITRMKECSIHKLQQEYTICLPLGWEQLNVPAKNATCETKIQSHILV